jgi:hypothetical protein
MKTQFKVIAAALLVFGAGAITTAYSTLGHKWAVQQVPYYINPGNKYMSDAAALSAIQAAASNWTAQSNANILLYYMGRTSGASISINGRSEVFFRDESAGSTYGETYVWWNGATGDLIETDTIFYTGYFTFVADEAACPGGAAVYLQDAATHELGHALGLAHSSVSTASMNAWMPGCTTSFRTLDPDDQAGIESLYPTGGVSNSAPSVSIASPTGGSAFTEGSAIGFSGAASDKEDGTLTTYIVWTSNISGQIGSGGSFSQSLPAGAHTITASVTDSRGLKSTKQVSVTVTSPVSAPSPSPSSPISLSARAYKVKGVKQVDLSWTGATSASVSVFRNGTAILTTDNDGRETDRLNTKGGGSYTYKLCESGTSTCSASINVSF